MACFLVPAAEAVVTTVATKIVEAKEKKAGTGHRGAEEAAMAEQRTKLPFSRKLKWLNRMLSGGAVLLAFEHVWHGEVTPWFPFLTAAGNAADAAEMFREMAVSGTAMAVLVTAVWGVMVAVSNVMEKRADRETEAQLSEN